MSASVQRTGVIARRRVGRGRRRRVGRVGIGAGAAAGDATVLARAVVAERIDQPLVEREQMFDALTVGGEGRARRTRPARSAARPHTLRILNVIGS